MIKSFSMYINGNCFFALCNCCLRKFHWTVLLSGEGEASYVVGREMKSISFDSDLARFIEIVSLYFSV